MDTSSYVFDPIQTIELIDERRSQFEADFKSKFVRYGNTIDSRIKRAAQLTDTALGKHVRARIRHNQVYGFDSPYDHLSPLVYQSMSRINEKILEVGCGDEHDPYILIDRGGEGRLLDKETTIAMAREKFAFHDPKTIHIKYRTDAHNGADWIQETIEVGGETPAEA